MLMDEHQIRRIGRHTVSFEPPRLICFVLCGDISVQEIVDIAAFVQEKTGHLPFVLGLGDLSELGDIPSEARKMGASLIAQTRYGALAFFGASFKALIVAKLVLGALRLFTRDQVPKAFFDTEAQARAWLEERAREIPVDRSPGL
jgi:hypothetical protein